MHLTERRYSDTASCANSESSEEAGAPEIEVTPAMIEAGAQELADSYMFDIETLESRVVSIFKTMVLASLR
jgi:hypothetical protein